MTADLRVGVRQATPPRVSIVTTVYDRTACLDRCLRAMQHSHFADYEQIVVSDAPGPKVEQAIAALVTRLADPRVRYLALPTRHNDWGITPAAAGWQDAGGAYVGFLSDDNAYLPDHLGRLVAALDADPAVGFAYSSCQYAGRRVLSVAPPKPAQIDLGQPLFRRPLLADCLRDQIPQRAHAWDWAIIHRLLEAGVRWVHVDEPSFIFRLAAYPQLMRALA